MLELRDVISAKYRDPKAMRVLENSTRTVFRQDNFTIVVFSSPKGLAVGAAKCNTNYDEYSEVIGERLATFKAYMSYLEEGWQ